MRLSEQIKFKNQVSVIDKKHKCNTLTHANVKGSNKYQLNGSFCSYTNIGQNTF